MRIPSNKPGMCRIYALCDPNDLVPRYVGQSAQKYLCKRINSHIEDARKLVDDNPPKQEWIRSILTRGERPAYVIIEECLKEHGDEREQYWIDTLPNLFNRPVIVPPMGGWNKIALHPDIESRIGTMPDYKLAEMIGCCKSVIARRRREIGIRPYAETTGNNGQYKKGNYPAQWLKQR